MFHSRPRRPLAAAVTMLLLAGSTPAADESVTEQGVRFLRTHCYRCHGDRKTAGGLNVLDRATLVRARNDREPAYVKAGNPADSWLWQRAALDRDMPPAKSPQPSDAELTAFRRWIEQGAAFPTEAARRPVGTAEVLEAIRDDLRSRAEEDRPFARYFSLAHLHNDARIGADELRLLRAALSKLANSLSWKATIELPAAVDREATVLAIDLRDLGWDRDGLWLEVLKAYPYGLVYEGAGGRLHRAYREVAELSQCPLPVVRADWFLATASRPPLYHRLLRLPATAGELEQKLLDGRSVRENFLRDKAVRIGLTSSGVARRNRLLERHPALYGACWKSYDFRSDEGAGSLTHFPLGPEFAKHPFARQAFQHDGGEIIFHLPNGLQGYLLVNGKDERLDGPAPTDVVRDLGEGSGEVAIVNGLSCMGCHRHGMIGGFRDAVRTGAAVAGAARRKVERLYPEADVVERLLRKDTERFLQALDEAAGPFLRTADDTRRAGAFAEPISAAARRYLRDLALEDAAAELDLAAGELRDHIDKNPRLRQRFGLGVLLDGGRLSRTAWERPERQDSLFQLVSGELDRGQPYRAR